MVVASLSWIQNVLPTQTIPYILLYTENQPTLSATYIRTLATQFQQKTAIHALIYGAKMFLPHLTSWPKEWITSTEFFLKTSTWIG